MLNNSCSNLKISQFLLFVKVLNTYFKKNGRRKLSCNRIISKIDFKVSRVKEHREG